MQARGCSQHASPSPPPPQSLEWMFKMQSAPSETAAIILEPVLGEGGFLTPPPGFMRGLRKLCDDHGIVLIADEVGARAGQGPCGGAGKAVL